MSHTAPLPSALRPYARAFEQCEPYLVLSDLWLDRVSRQPMGIELADRNCINPHEVGSAPFLNLAQRLDDLVFDPLGMGMPKWAFYDCAQMPGGIFGFARPASQLPPWLRSAMKVPADYDGLVPVSALILIPMVEPGAFLNYGVCSINDACPGGAPAGLGLLTCALGLELFRVRRLYATKQWRSPDLQVHTRFGPLELLTAFTPAHTLETTLTFRFDVTRERLTAALAGDETTPKDAEWLDADDVPAMKQLQAELEAGACVHVVGRPVEEGSVVRVPLRRTEKRSAP